ncbi:universal stress protein [Lactococcus lactis]|uniref:Universal stress protein n=1 Tax=Lactococcus lactis TaxID=1358 RepID=A0AAP5P7Z8_9LACT|nr:universal stress protein [Lactococcus lactis]MDT2859200.1 universal stress protein [Lactococcus lactis]MDT2861418.1 universal stress protein [Lactococcus lactis]MDT2867402.1 universal stress protein [Lactococcus lactis]MDT2870570.1 universal stress protein [Lactococcus lactis]MDT2872140.1 universal stress protein [Lactococcus lactis]
MKDVYKKILVPVDGSAPSKEAIHEAVAIAKRNKTSLFILHVKDETRLRGTPYALAINLDDLETESKAIISEVGDLINGEVEFEIHTYTGNPKKYIVKFAEENAIDLVVIGSNSKKLVDRILVGSTTSYVVEKSPCNVMVVK